MENITDKVKSKFFEALDKCEATQKCELSDLQKIQIKIMFQDAYLEALKEERNL